MEWLHECGMSKSSNSITDFVNCCVRVVIKIPHCGMKFARSTESARLMKFPRLMKFTPSMKFVDEISHSTNIQSVDNNYMFGRFAFFFSSCWRCKLSCQINCCFFISIPHTRQRFATAFGLEGTIHQVRMLYKKNRCCLTEGWTGGGTITNKTHHVFNALFYSSNGCHKLGQD